MSDSTDSHDGREQEDGMEDGNERMKDEDGCETVAPPLFKARMRAVKLCVEKVCICQKRMPTLTPLPTFNSQNGIAAFKLCTGNESTTSARAHRCWRHKLGCDRPGHVAHEKLLFSNHQSTHRVSPVHDQRHNGVLELHPRARTIDASSTWTFVLLNTSHLVHSSSTI